MVTGQRLQTSFASAIWASAGSAVPDWEEQLRILVTTDRIVAPIHTSYSSLCAQQDARAFFFGC